MPSLIHAPSPAARWSVACLCARWCNTCEDYRSSFEALARAHPECQFIWIDIEDDSDWMGDIDVENFPTILMAHDSDLRFFGTVTPHPQTLARLLEATLDGARSTAGLDAAVHELAARLPEWRREQAEAD